MAATTRVTNETFGMLLFLFAEVMFFAGLISAYIVLRLGAGEWHPEGLPPLYRGLSISNTILLCVSGGSMFLAERAIRRDDPGGLKLYLWITAILGVTFLGIQIYEFQRLMGFVPLDGNVFGGVFYTLSGLHGLHVLAGVCLLAWVIVRASLGKYHQYRLTGVVLSSYYWYFVVMVWVFLFFALYVA